MPTAPLRTVFFGSADISLPTLSALAAQEWCSVIAVVTQPDKPVGRKKVITPTPVKKLAIELDIPVVHSIKELPEDSYDVGVLVAYGRILKQADMDRFKHGIVNMHPSLLPKWRGSSPIQYALLNRDAETGISIMVLDEGMDTGPIIAQTTIALSGSETASAMHDRMAQSGAELLVDTLPGYVSGDITPTAQDNAAASYTKLISRADGQLFPTDSAIEMDAKYRAFHPWPGVFFIWNNRRYKVLEAAFQDNAFIINTIQPAGKQAMSFHEFFNGHQNFKLSDIEAKRDE